MQVARFHFPLSLRMVEEDLSSVRRPLHKRQTKYGSTIESFMDGRPDKGLIDTMLRISSIKDFLPDHEAMSEVLQKITACSSTAASANENSPLFSPLCWRPLGSDAEVEGSRGCFVFFIAIQSVQ